MKKVLSLLAAGMVAVTAYAQTDTISIDKFYFSRDQIIANSPGDTESNIQLLQRNPAEITLDDGNTYIPIVPKKSKIKAGALRKSIWAIGNGDDLYMNGQLLTKTKGYMKAETRGRYIFVMSAIPSQWTVCEELGILKDREELDVNLSRMRASRSGISGKEIGGTMPLMKGHKQYPVVYDVETNTIRSFTADFMNKCMDAYPALLEKYGEVDFDRMFHQDYVAFVNDLNKEYEKVR